MKKSKSTPRTALQCSHAIALLLSVSTLAVACGPKAGPQHHVEAPASLPPAACPANPEDDSFQGKAALAQAKQKLQTCLSSFGNPPWTDQARKLCFQHTNSQEFATVTD